MSIERNEQAEFFKLVRANVKPTNLETYHTIYTAAARMLLRSSMKSYFSSKTNSGMTNLPSGSHRVLEEQSAQEWIEDGTRLVGASVYTDESVHRQLYGIEADVAVAPESGTPPSPLFELSTDGTLYWITECDTLRPATSQEMWQLIQGLDAVE